MALIMGLAIIGFAYINYLGKIKTQQTELKKELIIQEAKNECIKESQTVYEEAWNNECFAGNGDSYLANCRLPYYAADRLEKYKQTQIENCINKYK